VRNEATKSNQDLSDEVLALKDTVSALRSQIDMLNHQIISHSCKDQKSPYRKPERNIRRSPYHPDVNPPDLEWNRHYTPYLPSSGESSSTPSTHNMPKSPYRKPKRNIRRSPYHSDVNPPDLEWNRHYTPYLPSSGESSSRPSAPPLETSTNPHNMPPNTSDLNHHFYEGSTHPYWQPGYYGAPSNYYEQANTPHPSHYYHPLYHAYEEDYK
jgi:hypothetical protein